MTFCVVHFYNQVTGYIDAKSWGDKTDTDPLLQLPNVVVTSNHIPAVLTTAHADRQNTTENTTVDAAWLFVLDNKGKPSIDANGNYLVMPPPFSVSLPGSYDYALLGHLKAGHLNISDIHPDHIIMLNRSFAAAGLPRIPSTTLVPNPIKTATTNSASLAVKIPKLG